MIKGFCHTNLDDYKHKEWPTEFVAVPRKGEYVASESSGCSLKVCNITYIMMEDRYSKAEPFKYPGIKVELNK